MATITREFIVTFDDADFHVPRAVLAARVAHIITAMCDGAAPQHHIRALGYEIDTPEVKIANGWRFSIRVEAGRKFYDIGLAVGHLVDHACEAYIEARNPPAEAAGRWNWWEYDPEKDDDTAANDKPWYPDDSGKWIEWAGGDCPVDGEAKVKHLLRREREAQIYKDPVLPARVLSWSHRGEAYDIVAYRVVGDDE